MDTFIATWEMNLDPLPAAPPQEGLATGPMEPYTLDRNAFSWN